MGAQREFRGTLYTSEQFSIIGVCFLPLAHQYISFLGLQVLPCFKEVILCFLLFLPFLYCVMNLFLPAELQSPKSIPKGKHCV